MAGLKAICIIPYKDIKLFEVVKVFDIFGRIHLKKLQELKFSFNVSLMQYQKHFLPLIPLYSIQQPIIKKRFRRPKVHYYTAYFYGISDDSLVELAKRVFYYLEMCKQINPELIQTFNYSIESTLKNLEVLFKTLPESQFVEAILDSEQVFKGVYDTALSIESKQISLDEGNQTLLDNFKKNNQIIGQFFNELNNKDKSP